MQGSSNEVIVYQENRIRVLQYLRQGKPDYFDLSSWPFQDRFFAFLLAIDFFNDCAESYPSPRKKQEVPLWVLLTCQLLLKLDTTAIHSKLPGLLKSGPLLARIRFNIGPCDGGFNHKNKKAREVIVHHDTVRKFFKTTDRDDLRRWYCRDFVRFIRHKRGFDKHGIFLLDQTHIVVPRNPRYEGVEYLRVDEFGHRIVTDGMSPEARKAIRPRPCYTLSELVHVGKQDECNVVAGYDWGGGNEDELVQGQRLVDTFVETVGKGVMQLLIMDRGYIDGEFITHVKRDLGCDVMIPLRKNMQMLQYGIAQATLKQVSGKWHRYRDYHHDGQLYREEVFLIPDAYTWEECHVELNLSLMRRRCISSVHKQVQYWGLATTYCPKSPKEAFKTYHLRVGIEERYRQHKHFWNLHRFSSPDKALMETHVAFTLMTYTLLQLYLKKNHLSEMANKTLDTLKAESQKGNNSVVVYKDTNFGVFDLDFYTEVIADLNESGRVNIKEKIAENRKKFG